MYYKLKIYVKGKVFSKFRFNVDEQYLEYIIKSLFDQSDFIKIAQIIINKSQIKYVNTKQMIKRKL